MRGKFSTTETPDYGIDSPAIVLGEFLLGTAVLLSGALFPHLLGSWGRWIAVALGAYILSSGLNMLVYSKVGKLRIRDQMLDSILWKGDEQVLDVGCGRGLLLVDAAKRLTTGRAFGVDRWLRTAVSGNTAASALRNAALEGVDDRVDVQEGDIRELPYADESFDVILSNFVLHEVNTPAERKQMLSEIVRVLKPGGRAVLVDFIFTQDGVEALREMGLIDARRNRLGKVSFWFGAILTVGLVRVYQVSATKPRKARTVAPVS